MFAWALSAWASPGDGLARARALERGGRWDDAAQACAEEEGAPEAATCAEMAARWDARRDADGTFTSQGLLEAARRGEAATDTVAALPDGAPDVLRVEAASLRARGALTRGDAAGARAMVEPWVGVDVGDPRVEAVARSLLAEIDAELGVVGAADGTRAAQRESARWVRGVDGAAVLAVGVGVVGCVPAALRGRASRPRPWGALLIAGAGSAAWALAEGWEDGGGRSIPAMSAALIAIHLVAATALAAPTSAAHGWALRGLTAAASAGACWLALSWTGGLQALGL